MRGWQEVDLDGPLGEQVSAGLDPDPQFAPPRSVDAGQERGIELYVETPDMVDGLVGDAFYAPDARGQERRFCRQVDGNIC